ncbi:MAG: zinc metallopeptidase [Clostridia bacterium]|nr:zinc metallopeptidase [Clostridia bacterium]
MGMYYYGIDYTYIIFVLPAIIISLIAQFKVTSTFSKYSKILSFRQITGADVARRILDKNALSSVALEHVRGNLTDHYDPRSKVLRLSDSVFSSKSIAALGVAAHECGHAIQHSKGYIPLKLRHAIYPAVRFSSAAAMPLILIGLIVNTPFLLTFGITLFSAVVLFQLITLPVEFNASKRALSILRESRYLEDDELKAAKKVLTAAALTYVASALTSMMQLLRFIVLANNRRR